MEYGTKLTARGQLCADLDLQEQTRVTRAELYATLDDILEIPIGTLTGNEELSALHSWDSLAVVNFIATVNGLFNVVLPAQKVKVCRSVPDLVALVNVHLKD